MTPVMLKDCPQWYILTLAYRGWYVIIGREVNRTLPNVICISAVYSIWLNVFYFPCFNIMTIIWATFIKTTPSTMEAAIARLKISKTLWTTLRFFYCSCKHPKIFDLAELDSRLCLPPHDESETRLRIYFFHQWLNFCDNINVCFCSFKLLLFQMYVFVNVGLLIVEAL